MMEASHLRGFGDSQSGIAGQRDIEGGAAPRMDIQLKVAIRKWRH